MDKKRPLSINIIAVFVFLLAFFYFIFGALFSGLLFYFWKIMTSSLHPPKVIFDPKIIKESFTFTNYILGGYIFGVSLIAMIIGIIFILSGIGLLRAKNFARILILFFSSFEIIFSLRLIIISDFFVFFLYLIIHGSIIYYLVFNQEINKYFRQKIF